MLVFKYEFLVVVFCKVLLFRAIASSGAALTLLLLSIVAVYIVAIASNGAALFIFIFFEV
ncbi:hypothetical protein BVRB_6g139810 [Beta vulgaris subsp. vulgaris]|nr:hypothetical protein BVRB_6g139810 [Beta vulgaris subsp. vulgaris]